MGFFGSSETSLESLLKRLHALGIIECRGSLQASMTPIQARDGISQGEIDEILSILLAGILGSESESRTNRRQIQEAKQMFNAASHSFSIDTENKRAGYLFRRNRDGAIHPDDLKSDRGYETFFLLSLALMHLDHSADLDILTQFRALDFPLASLLFLHYCIRAGRKVSFQYQNRSEAPVSVANIVPARIVLRNGHWLLIARDQEKDIWIQYLVHSIQSIEDEGPSRSTIPALDMQKHFGEIWGHAVLSDSPGPTVVQILVPRDAQNKVQKRRSEGHWLEAESPGHCIWEVPAFDLDDLLSYVFKWNGLLRVIGPDEAVDRFRQMLQRQLDYLTES